MERNGEIDFLGDFWRCLEKLVQCEKKRKEKGAAGRRLRAPRARSRAAAVSALGTEPGRKMVRFNKDLIDLRLTWREMEKLILGDF